VRETESMTAVLSPWLYPVDRSPCEKYTATTWRSFSLGEKNIVWVDVLEM
jgi:hypothetical protein